ncbi:Retrovirus-related Pol polyprotein from transposon 17.6 [Araneus ventricosus]|uniref:RNA-directed DNA polymerase n=1 Tax=Araneus ventricosus TaxID=182803 RepID=A0A4Y2Q1P0_ARAVE|nr:Retrovirus-related Pol polyprotein from transposon 17.6 [Araneus ventricosus]
MLTGHVLQTFWESGNVLTLTKTAYGSSPCDNRLKQEIKRMLDLGVIEVGESNFSSPLILVEAPGRDPCVGYRKLNSVTRAEYFPLPNIEERIELVANARYITVIDLTKGYWQIPLTPQAQRYAAFPTPFNPYKPLTMPLGLINAPFCFSKFMATLSQGCEKYCVPYLNDVATFSDTWEKHREHLNKILEKIASAKLKIKSIKCKFEQDCVKYLGHKVGGGCRTHAEAKIQAVLDFPAPRYKTEIHKMLGMIAYYSRYIEIYATLVEPITRALKGKTRKESITWTSEMEEALRTVKQRLTEKPVLYAPNFEKEFIVQTGASDFGIGVVLAQRTNGEEHTILYLSRKFSGPEKKYSTTEKECAAIIFAIKKLRYYLDGQKFIIETDHNPLVWLKTNAGNNPRLMRYALALQPFNYTLVHKPAKNIVHAYCLSRM